MQVGQALRNEMVVPAQLDPLASILSPICNDLAKTRWMSLGLQLSIGNIDQVQRQRTSKARRYHRRIDPIRRLGPFAFIQSSRNPLP